MMTDKVAIILANELLFSFITSSAKAASSDIRNDYDLEAETINIRL
jgi:hypothetical protein